MTANVSSRTRTDTLTALNRAALAVTGELSLDNTLQQIVDSARSLVHARYAALGIPGAGGTFAQFLVSGISPEDAARIGRRPEGRGLLGVVLREGCTIRIPDTRDDPRSVGFPPGHPEMTSLLGVPICAQDRVLGNLYLTDKIGADEFTDADQQLIEILASHAAVAIQNARLYAQAGRLAILEERARIGMDLHDGVIQSIYAVGLTLESARLLLREDFGAADEILVEAIAGLNDAIRDMRNFILDLRPHRFDGDLGSGIARLVREFQANALVPVELQVSPEVVEKLPVGVAQTLFLSAQEALANVARHARASRVVLEVTHRNGIVRLSVRDDGRGFDLEGLSQSPGHGLANMRVRAEELSGSFTLDTNPGQGTTLCLAIPL